MKSCQTNARVFSGTRLLNRKDIEGLRESINHVLPSYSYDQYVGYPSTKKDAWRTYYLSRLNNVLKDAEWTFFLERNSNHPVLVGCRIHRWDEEHFGIRMASVSVLINSNDTGLFLSQLLSQCLAYLKAEGVKFISARIHGDNLSAIHIFEKYGFRYYENIIWPVLSCDLIKDCSVENVRLMDESDLERVIAIAGKNSFQRSHFHCDHGFSRIKADGMHAKWIKTSWANNEPIAVIESDGTLAGYFAFKLDAGLSDAMGYRYARMRALSLDSKFRGMGLGKNLFSGTIMMMKKMGAEYVDSGYASKNLVSAKLHVQHSFEPVYEEVTLHLWI